VTIHYLAAVKPPRPRIPGRVHVSLCSCVEHLVRGGRVLEQLQAGLGRVRHLFGLVLLVLLLALLARLGLAHRGRDPAGHATRQGLCRFRPCLCTEGTELKIWFTRRRREVKTGPSAVCAGCGILGSLFVVAASRASQLEKGESAAKLGEESASGLAGGGWVSGVQGWRGWASPLSEKTRPATCKRGAMNNPSKALAVFALLSVLAPHPVSGYLQVARAGLLMGCQARHLPARAQFVSHKHRGSARLRQVVERLHPSLACSLSLTQSQLSRLPPRRASLPLRAQVDGLDTYNALVSWLFGMYWTSDRRVPQRRTVSCVF
jgi:hypothetical protein